MNEKLNIETRAISRESPFSSGIVEKHKILFEAFSEILEVVSCEPEKTEMVLDLTG